MGFFVAHEPLCFNVTGYYDVSLEHVDITTDYMQKYGVGRMAKPPKAAEWVKLDLLQKAKAELKVK